MASQRKCLCDSGRSMGKMVLRTECDFDLHRSKRTELPKKCLCDLIRMKSRMVCRQIGLCDLNRSTGRTSVWSETTFSPNFWAESQINWRNQPKKKLKTKPFEPEKHAQVKKRIWQKQTPKKKVHCLWPLGMFVQAKAPHIDWRG